MSDPSPLSQGLGIIAAACLVLLIAAVIANIRWPKTHSPTTTGPTTRGCTTTGCAQPPVERYHGRNLCRDCADELAALDQMILQQQQEFDDFNAWERDSGGAS